MPRRTKAQSQISEVVCVNRVLSDAEKRTPLASPPQPAAHVGAGAGVNATTTTTPLSLGDMETRVLRLEYALMQIHENMLVMSNQIDDIMRGLDQGSDEGPAEHDLRDDDNVNDENENSESEISGITSASDDDDSCENNDLGCECES